MDFSNGAGQTTGSELIPTGTLVWAILSVRAVKTSTNTGSRYLDVELTIDEGQPFERRKIWEMIGDPTHQGNSDAYRQMGQVAIARILEAGRNAGPHNPAGYQLPDNDWSPLNGLRVAIKVGFSKGKDGFEDKNRVGEWLTPNPASGSGHKDFAKLISGQGGAPAAAQPRQAQAGQQSFGGFGGGAPGGMGGPGSGFGGGQQASGFQAPAQGQGNFAPPAAGNSSGTGFVATPPASQTSRSEPAASGWLAQANSQG